MRVTEATVRRIAKTADAASINEQITRKRVADLEQGINAVLGLLARGFWGRLKWLAVGR